MKPSKSTCALLALALAALAFCGCRSLDQPASASFASVVVPNRSVDEIRRATQAVFVEAGYDAFSSGDRDLIFEKEGTRRNQVAHGNWMEDSPVRERVRAEIVPQNDGSLRLQCKAYMVRDADSALIEEEVRLAHFRARPYQELLNRVAARLR